MTVRPLSIADIDDIVATAARAFTIDPMFGYLARDRLHAHRLLPGLLSGVSHDLAHHGMGWVAEDADGVTGVAGWCPPGTLPRGLRRDGAIALRGLRAGVRLAHPVRGLRLLAHVEKSHPHDEHWYLALLTVDPQRQGRGLGSALIQPGLDRADDDGLPAYLETQKESNISWYARFGFELTRTIELRATPPVWCLTRQPR